MDIHFIYHIADFIRASIGGFLPHIVGVLYLRRFQIFHRLLQKACGSGLLPPFFRYCLQFPIYGFLSGNAFLHPSRKCFQGFIRKGTQKISGIIEIDSRAILEFTPRLHVPMAIVSIKFPMISQSAVTYPLGRLSQPAFWFHNRSNMYLAFKIKTSPFIFAVSGPLSPYAVWAVPWLA